MMQPQPPHPEYSGGRCNYSSGVHVGTSAAGEMLSVGGVCYRPFPHDILGDVPRMKAADTGINKAP